MSVSINGTNGLTFNDGSAQTTSAFTGGFAMRNRIINGAMVIDQRNAGASVTPATGAYTLDRWITYVGAASKLSIQRSSTAPTGFTNSALITSLSAYTVGASETFLFGQKIEGFNFADMGWGTANAATVTLSFWVRSSLTGTFGGSLGNGADNRWYPFSYTISAANTWEQKTLTIAGDTSGTWVGATNGIGLNVYFNLGTGATYSGTAGSWTGTTYYSSTGATSVVGTNGATFYITGVQLEKGSTATSFDYRPYGTELQLCQRYFQSWGGTANYEYIGIGCAQVTNIATIVVPMQVQMRAAPALAVSSAGNFRIFNGSTYATVTAMSINAPSNQVAGIDCTVASGVATGTFWQLGANNTTSAKLQLSSEL
jgi:hypothetical protein